MFTLKAALAELCRMKRARTRKRTHARKYVHKFGFCKVDFAKNRKLAFYSQKICIYEKKVVPLYQI